MALKTVADNVPPVEEVLSLDFDRKLYPEADVTLEQALSYLRRESITLPPDVPKGLVTITYMGLPLGMAKNIGSRANNLYPKTGAYSCADFKECCGMTAPGIKILNKDER